MSRPTEPPGGARCNECGRPDNPDDEATAERAEKAVEEILRPYAPTLSPDILAERIVEAVLSEAYAVWEGE